MNEAAARLLVRSRSTGLCELCRDRPATNWSHRKSRAQGGPWRPCNGLDLCGSGTTGCHGWLTANPLLAADGGWQLLRDDRDPATVPVWLDAVLVGPGWWLLDDEGCYLYPETQLELPVLPPWARRAGSVRP